MEMNLDPEPEPEPEPKPATEHGLDLSDTAHARDSHDYRRCNTLPRFIALQASLADLA
jgi:hypothetical protein